MSSKGNHFDLYMFQQDLENMTNWVLQYPNSETGGDLFGLWSGEEDNAVIHVVLGPGRDCTHGDYHFYQDVNYLEKVGNLLTENYMLGHIGEWHSHHHLKLDRPSDGDCSTIQRNFPQGSCGFFLMIANIRSKEEVSFSPYIFKAGSRRGKAGKVKVITERSPFAMLTPICQNIKEGKEAELRKGREKEEGEGKEISFFLPDNMTSMTMETGDREFSSNGLRGIQNNRMDLTDIDSGSTRMLPVYKVKFPAKSDSQWYSKEENGDLLHNIYLGLHNLVGKVEITFNCKEYTNDMNMKFDYQGGEMRLSFSSGFPDSAAGLYIYDSFKRFFRLYKNNDLKSHDLSKFMKEIHDFLQDYFPATHI